MNKLEEKLKPRNVERYKSGETKFSSMEQSRQLRALKKKQEQKDSRDAILNKMRRAAPDTPQSKSGQCPQQVSQASSTKKFSKRELKELGLKRYQEMLRFKEKKRKLLEQEKKARKPTFKTGVVIPDKPQYLQDAYVDKKEQTTPFKFAVVSRGSSTKKSSLMLSASKENIFGRSSRALSFHSGATPQTSGAATSASNIHGSRRANRVFRPPPQFGVSPLPNTPSFGGVKPFPRTPGLLAPSRSFKILKESAKSFAPNTFNFEVPKGLRRYTIKESSVFRSIDNSPSRREELDFAKEVGLHNFENDGSEENVSAELLENNELERSTLRDTFFVDNKKDNEIEAHSLDNEIETHSLDNKTETCSINSGNGKDNDIEINNDDDLEDFVDAEENLQVDGENDMDYAGEIRHFEEKRSEKSSEEEVGIESNIREKINEPENKLESGQLDSYSEDDEHEDKSESGQMDSSNEDDEHEDKSESEEMECSSEDFVKKIKVQDVKCELSGFEDERSSGTLPILPLREEKKGLAELPNVKKENISEEELTDYKPKIEEDNNKKEYLEDEQENMSDRKVKIKSSTKKRGKSLANFTPPLSKLRPRTPCSRSTRRSMIAHCNTPCLGDHSTPMTKSLSKRRKSKRSLTVASKIELDSEPSENFVIKAIPEINTASKTPSQNPEDDVLKTPLTDERLRQLESSPWITRSRGSDSSNSSKRKSVFKTQIEKETGNQCFDKLYKNPWISKSRGSSKSLKRKNALSDSPGSVMDFCITGSPALKNRLVCDFGSPSLKRSLIPLAVQSFPSLSKTDEPLDVESVKDVNSPLLKKSSLFPFVSETSSPEFEASLPPELVQTQRENISESPDVCVWGPESLTNSPVVPITKLPNFKDNSETNVSQNTEAKALKAKRRSSKRVSLLVDPDKENEDDVTTKYPVTPRRKSSRFSSVGNQRVSLLPGLYPHDENIETSRYEIDEDADLILLDSPAVALSGGNGRLTSRLSQRVSLLPGLSSHPEEEDHNLQSPVNKHSDPIAWDSPLVASGRRKSRKKSNVDTPMRRSKRLSKI